MLMSTFFRRAAQSSPSPRATIEGLERRTMLAATGPVLTGIRVLGPATKANGIVLSFDSSLDLASAQNTSNYVFGHATHSSSDNGIDLGTILGFLVQHKGPAVKNGKVQFLGAAYDDSTHTVTLTPRKAFNTWKFFRILRVKGTGDDPITDLSGEPLNGGEDTALHWNRERGKTIKYSDVDGDKVAIKLKGPGKLYAFFHKSGDPFPSIFVIGTKAGKSTLTGTVDQSPTGNGIAHIAQLTGSVPTDTNMFSNTQIDVQST